MSENLKKYVISIYKITPSHKELSLEKECVVKAKDKTTLLKQATRKYFEEEEIAIKQVKVEDVEKLITKPCYGLVRISNGVKEDYFIIKPPSKPLY